MATPPGRFARSGDVDIAYQVVGDGPLDLLWVELAGSGLELLDRGSHALKGVPGEWRGYAVA